MVGGGGVLFLCVGVLGGERWFLGRGLWQLVPVMPTFFAPHHATFRPNLLWGKVVTCVAGRAAYNHVISINLKQTLRKQFIYSIQGEIMCKGHHLHLAFEGGDALE